MHAMNIPTAVASIRSEARRLGFTQSCDEKTGALLRTLVGSKPHGRILELGTGVGHSAAWMLDGMDPGSRLTSVEIEQSQLEIAKTALGLNPQVEFIHQDGADFLDRCLQTFDLIFADAWPGKFTHRDRAIALLRPGGLYIIDDLNLQPDWPTGHADNVERLIAAIEADPALHIARISDSTGLILACRAV